MASSSNHDKQVIQSRILSCGRGFAAVDPERQREVDVEYIRTTRREDSSPLRGRSPSLAGWFSAQREPGDEGGSVRRAR